MPAKTKATRKAGSRGSSLTGSRAPKLTKGSTAERAPRLPRTPAIAASIASRPSAYAAAFAADYAAAPESVQSRIADRHGLFINGKFVEPVIGTESSRIGDSRTIAGGLHFATINPATERPLSLVARAGPADVDAAVSAARQALPAWAGLRAKERAKYLYRIARRIQERARELAVLETLDGGKPIKESRDVDVPLAAAHFFYYAGWADKLEHVFGPGVRPVGVCGQIIPWNFPLLMAAWKLAPALACGNTCVLKPAETTPLTALRLAEILVEVGLPPGVVNVLTGEGATGAALVEHPGVDKIAFTGSTEVGKRLARATAGTRKRLTLELGGKSPNIIFEDASLDQAIEGIVQGIYFNQGHVCCAGSRLFVQESIQSEVIKRLRARLSTLRVGDPMDKNTDVGAINSREQMDRIGGYLDSGVAEGAELMVCGVGSTDTTKGRRNVKDKQGAASGPSENGTRAGHNGVHRGGEGQGSALAVPAWRKGLPKAGFWCRPCFFTGVQPSHTVAREEIFGPVLSVMTFRTPEEAIVRANSTPYGLAAGVWTDKGSKIFETARRLKAGVVWLNTYNKFDPGSPFGGFKESGFGREGGVQGLRGYVETH